MGPLERFLRYIKIDSTADPRSETVPSSKGQELLASKLVKELADLGLDEITYKAGVVYAKLPSNSLKSKKSLGLIAHLDTSPDMSGANVKARIIKNYDGNRIDLNEELSMGSEDFPVLKEKRGHDLVVTDGRSLLGADNKAGIAIIMGFLERISEEALPHPDIYIAFTSDEEIGRGTDYFDLSLFKADFAYTVDGGDISYIDYENFNAATAIVLVQGQSIHPGAAKGKMKNAILLAMEFQALLPSFLNPAFTEGYEGFNHITEIEGRCEEARMEYIIRNHDRKLFEDQKETFKKNEDFLNSKHGQETFKVQIEDSYYNMLEIIKEDMTPVELAKSAMEGLGLNPKSTPIRGGTDGARLTYMGLPCPNIGTGGYNFHGKYEFLSINEMEIGVKLVLAIARKLA